MKNEIPTAKEYCQLYLFNNKLKKPNLYDAIVAFTKLHVEEALKQAYYSSQLSGYDVEKNKASETRWKTVTCGGVEYSTNQKSIIEAYPLENIK